MAEKDRRGEQPADDENLDEVFDDAVDDDADDEPVSRSGGTATRTRPKAGQEDKSTKTKRGTERRGPFGWIIRFFGWLRRFFREVVAELRKVIWPTRKELLTYTAVVIVFVSVIVAIVTGLDYVLAKGALFVFGNPK